MAKCLFCERKSLFLRVNSEGYCKDCVPRVAARRRDAEEKKRKEEKERAERIRRADEESRIAMQKNAEANMHLSSAVFSLDLINSLRNDFFALDVETTGFSPISDRIVEISVVRYKDGVVLDSFSELLNAGVPIPKAATDVNHITNEMIQNARSEQSVMSSFFDYLSSSQVQDIVFVSHNAQFDISFLRSSLVRCGMSISAVYVDTLSLSREHIKGLKDYKLSTVSNYLNIEQSEYHRATSDAIACGSVLLLLLPFVEKPFLKEKEEIEKAKAFDQLRATLEISPIHDRIPLSEIKNFGDISAGYQNGYMHYIQGDIYSKSYKYSDALKFYDLARANGYCSPALYLSYAILFRRQKDYENEIAICEEGIARMEGENAKELIFRRNKAIELLLVSRERSARMEKVLIEKQQKKEAQSSNLDKKAHQPKQKVGRRIRQINDDGDLICEYDSLTEASIAVGVNMKSIRSAAIGIQKHAGGYKWEYVDDIDQ